MIFTFLFSSALTHLRFFQKKQNYLSIYIYISRTLNLSIIFRPHYVKQRKENNKVKASNISRFPCASASQKLIHIEDQYIHQIIYVCGGKSFVKKLFTKDYWLFFKKDTNQAQSNLRNLRIILRVISIQYRNA